MLLWAMLTLTVSILALVHAHGKRGNDMADVKVNIAVKDQPTGIPEVPPGIRLPDSRSGQHRSSRGCVPNERMRGNERISSRSS